ncbi:PAS domain S-box protein [Flavitalea sp. BT771]|uniref:PAS domain S-box protein n=1 Tax=Flavitalea sp. BT771 TaxID=3063329 RepID=UPI0026E2C94B|nr:PAS domain S-box protein [Flavitalea sp. BT771]MDO6430579.1 PAS domain S-box protein [Flavitalea sp. BT771]MDV6219281.1 PAS domain S-box protein [Flavitalea sp. BT771]
MQKTMSEIMAEGSTGYVFPAFLQRNDMLDLLPVATYACDLDGCIKGYNKEAVKLWGRAPEMGAAEQRYSGAYKLYNINGDLLPHDHTSAAACLKDGVARKDVEVVVERPDHSRIDVRVNVGPLRDENGVQVGMISCLYDITTQKSAEKKLQEKTAELQDYLDNANIGLHWVDGNGVIKWANKAEMDMLGYTQEEYIGHHIAEFHVSQEKIGEILKRLADDENLVQYESELRAKDGSVRIVHISSSVLRENGNFKHTRCFTIDVTEQKKLYQALRESELRYRQLIQSLDTPLYTTDAEGMITLFNRAAADLWGREPEIGKELWCGSFRIMRTDGSDLPLDSCPMALCLKEQRPVYGEQILVVRPDGSLRDVAPYPQPIFDDSGKITGAINMLVDITDMKENERALRESEEKYRTLANTLEMKVAEKINELKKSDDRYHKMIEEVEDYAIIMLDADGIIINWNKGAEKIKGYKEQEIVGKSFQEFYLAGDLQNGLPLILIREARENGKAAYEGWRKRKDGTKFWGSVLLTAMHDDHNNLIGFSKVTRDLTERKLAEDITREHLAMLEFQNKELEQFVYAASHDLKEPLRKIRLYNSYVVENPSNVLDATSMTYLERSINATERMKNLIEDLLTYSKATANTEAYEELDLNQLMHELVSFHKVDMEQKNITIEIEDLPMIHAIHFQVKQLFSNLIDNAIKYRHPDRDAHISIRSLLVKGDLHVSSRADPSKQYFKISVMDNGIGFDAKFADRIFEIFQRLATAKGVGGSGIGLAICTKIAQNHNGFIKADGTPGKGACFNVYFPKFE